jgi:hypothetical protein
LRKKIVPGVCVVVLASFLVTALRAAEQRDCRLKQYASLDLVEDPSKALVIPVTIQGTEAHMNFKAGNATSSVTEGAALRLSLHRQAIPWGINWRDDKGNLQRMAIAKTLVLGNVPFSRVQFFLEQDDDFPATVAGELGMSVFAHLDVEIDIANRKLNLYSQDHCPGQVVYWSNTYDAVPVYVGELGELYFPMSLEGKKIAAELATDSAGTTLTADVSRQLFDFDANSAGVKSATGADGRTTTHYRVMQLSAEGLNVINANIELVKRPEAYCRIISRHGATDYDDCVGLHPLKLGLNVLNRLHLYIATKEKIMYFTPAVVAH